MNSAKGFAGIDAGPSQVKSSLKSSGRTTRYKTAAKTAPINSAPMHTKKYHLGRESEVMAQPTSGRPRRRAQTPTRGPAGPVGPRSNDEAVGDAGTGSCPRAAPRPQRPACRRTGEPSRVTGWPKHRRPADGQRATSTYSTTTCDGPPAHICMAKVPICELDAADRAVPARHLATLKLLHGSLRLRHLPVSDAASAASE